MFKGGEEAGKYEQARSAGNFLILEKIHFLIKSNLNRRNRRLHEKTSWSSVDRNCHTRKMGQSVEQ